MEIHNWKASNSINSWLCSLYTTGWFMSKASKVNLLSQLFNLLKRLLYSLLKNSKLVCVDINFAYCIVMQEMVLLHRLIWNWGGAVRRLSRLSRLSYSIYLDGTAIRKVQTQYIHLKEGTKRKNSLSSPSFLYSFFFQSG